MKKIENRITVFYMKFCFLEKRIWVLEKQIIF
jgi:hypothetical protein